MNSEILDERTSILKENIDTNEDGWSSSEDSTIPKLNKQLGFKWVKIMNQMRGHYM